MDDKELLDFAAKAAGITKEAQAYLEAGWTGEPWNPLYNNGDALIVAVKLRMCVDCVLGSDVVLYQDPVTGDIKNIGIDISMTDRFKAVRRAITMAAAEIGKATK